MIRYMMSADISQFSYSLISVSTSDPKTAYRSGPIYQTIIYSFTLVNMF